MLIGIDASRSIETIKKTGVEVVSDELLKHLLPLEQKFDVDFIFYVPELISRLPQDKQRVIKFKQLWTVLGLSLEMLRQRPDVLFIPVHALPFFCPEKTYKLIHDVAFVKNPAAYSLAARLYLNFDTRRCVKRCTKIIVPTRQVKNDLVKYFSADEQKISIIPWGYSRKNPPPTPPLVRREGKKKQILYIGRIEEKKNIGNLIEAFKIFNKKQPDYKLILAGKPGHGFEKFESQLSNINCQMLGYVSDEEKYKLLSESAALVLVSKEEGFGIPLLEGFDFELPVLASDIPVLREVGGEACLFVDPDNVNDVAQGLERIVSDIELREQLIKQGRNRLKAFSWDHTARQLLTTLTSR